MSESLAGLTNEVLSLIGQDKVSAVVWLPTHNYPKALLIVAGPAGITVTGLRWPAYGPGRPSRVFVCKAADVRPPYDAPAAAGMEAIMAAYTGDKDVAVMNTGVFPEAPARRKLGLYKLETTVVQVVPAALSPGRIMV